MVKRFDNATTVKNKIQPSHKSFGVQRRTNESFEVRIVTPLVPRVRRNDFFDDTEEILFGVFRGDPRNCETETARQLLYRCRIELGASFEVVIVKDDVPTVCRRGLGEAVEERYHTMRPGTVLHQISDTRGQRSPHRYRDLVGVFVRVQHPFEIDDGQFKFRSQICPVIGLVASGETISTPSELE